MEHTKRVLDYSRHEFPPPLSIGSILSSQWNRQAEGNKSRERWCTLYTVQRSEAVVLVPTGAALHHMDSAFGTPNGACYTQSHSPSEAVVLVGVTTSTQCWACTGTAIHRVGYHTHGSKILPSLSERHSTPNRAPSLALGEFLVGERERGGERERKISRRMRRIRGGGGVKGDGRWRGGEGEAGSRRDEEAEEQEQRWGMGVGHLSG